MHAKIIQIISNFIIASSNTDKVLYNILHKVPLNLNGTIIVIYAVWKKLENSMTLVLILAVFCKP